MSDSGGKYRRDVGTIGVVFMVINGVIGAGIFGLPEMLHAAVGTFAPWLVLLASLATAFVALCFADLASMTDRSGGPQRYVTDAFGHFFGFQAGWLFYLSRMLTQAANVTVLVTYAAALWSGLDHGLIRTIAIIAVVSALTVINVVGIKRAVAVLGVITLFKLLPMVLLAAIGIALASGVGPVGLPQLSAVEGIALAALYAFFGFENATIPAGETSKPTRAMPRALLIGLPIIAGIYFALQFAYSNSPVAGSGATAPLAALADHYAGNVGAMLIAATVVVSVLGNMTAGHTVASRLTSSLADDRLLPAWFGKVSRWGTPANSILFFGAGALAFALSGTFAALAIAASLARMFVWIPSFLALPVLRKARGLAPLSGPLFVAVPVSLSLSIWASFQSSREQWLLIGAFLVIGTILFVLARGQRVAWAQRNG